MNHTFDGNDMNSNCAEKSGYNALSNDGNDDDKGMKKNLRRRNTARLDASSGNGSEQQQQAGNRSPINSASSVSSSTNPIKRQVDSSSLSPSSLVKQKVSIQRSDEFFSSHMMILLYILLYIHMMTTSIMDLPAYHIL